MFILLLLSLTLVDIDIKQAQIKARQDAIRDGTNYEYAGVLTPVISIAIASKSTPAIKSLRLLDKSDVYMYEYMKIYRAEKRKIELENAIVGSIWSLGVIWILFMIDR